MKPSAEHGSCLVSLMPFWLFHPPGSIFIFFMVPFTGPWSHWMLLASLWLFHPPGIFSFPPWSVQQGHGSYWTMLTSLWLFHPPGINSCFCMDTSLFSIQQAASLSLTILYHWFWLWRLILLPFHLNMDRSFDTAFSCYAQQAGCLLLSGLHHWFIFILFKMVCNPIWRPLWSCHLWRKSQHL